MANANWIERAEAKGMSTLQTRRDLQKVSADARANFSAEVVTEDAVKTYLDPFASPMLIVADELTKNGYGVTDDGYKYQLYVPDGDKYALTSKRIGNHGHEYDAAYGRVFTITTPDGNTLDTVGLLPLVNERTHFAQVSVMVESGRGILMDSPEKVKEAVTDIKRMIGSRISQYFEEHPQLNRNPGLFK